VVHGFVLCGGRDGDAVRGKRVRGALLPTGQWQCHRHPILPVIKLTANPRTVRTMSEHIDVDVSGLLRREMSPDEAGDKLLDMMFETANAAPPAPRRWACEFVLSRLYESGVADY